MPPTKTYHSLGLMSGSSLDGLDIAYCRIDWQADQVTHWELLASKTLPFSEKWEARLQGLPVQDALVFAKTHTYFGHYLAELVQQFIAEYQLSKIDFIASHGHTVFHAPDKRLSVQIGDGAALAALTEITTITNFRTQDVALDGEGAPLAPLADKYLFGGYDFYLNIGGIANLSANTPKGWVALDCCPANQVLNHLAAQKGTPYDAEGKWASQGAVNRALLQEVAQFDFYRQPYPKSLGNAWIRKNVLPQYLAVDDTIENKLATACEHIGIEIATVVDTIIQQEGLQAPSYKMLVTGGGAFNDYLIQTIRAYCNREHAIELFLPSPSIISFKESLLMSLLGVLRLEGMPNSLRSATGAKRDTVNGAVYWGKKKGSL